MTKLLVTKGFSVPPTACSQPEDWKSQFPRGVLWGHCHRTKEAPLLEHTCVGWTPTQVTMMPQLRINGVPSAGGPQRSAIAPQLGAQSPDPGLSRSRNSSSSGAETCRFQVFTPPIKSYKRGCAQVSHTSNPLSTSWLMQTSGRNWLAPKGRSPKPGRGAFTDHGWVAEGSAQELGAEADFAAAGREHVPGLAGLPLRGQSPLPPAPRLWHRAPGVGSEAGTAPRAAPTRLQTPI